MQKNNQKAPVVYDPAYNMDFGPDEFSARKYQPIYEILQAECSAAIEFVTPIPLTRSQAALIHTKPYLQDLLAFRRSERLISSEIPLTEAIVRSFFLAAGGTVLAARLALERGVAVNLGGGFHHAFPDHAEGFCYLHDVAIAIAVLRAERKVERVLVVDLDVHQGNGTAFVFRDQAGVFTFSMHEQDNYPDKVPGSLDCGLARGCEDAEYLRVLGESLAKIRKLFSPDLIFYVAGVDPYAGDVRGGLQLSREGLAKRDRLVLDYLPDSPRVMVLAGGYARENDDTARLHAQSCRIWVGG